MSPTYCIAKPGGCFGYETPVLTQGIKEWIWNGGNIEPFPKLSPNSFPPIFIFEEEGVCEKGNEGRNLEWTRG